MSHNSLFVDSGWIDTAGSSLNSYKRLLDRAVGQLSNDELHRRPATGFNSVGTLLRHLAGNLRSRWTDFLTTDGEKPDRDRDCEFEDWTGTRHELLLKLDEGWQRFAEALELIRSLPLETTIAIRGERHSLPQAVTRSLTHFSYHVGQIMLIGRLVHQGEWEWLTIAPGQSGKHNQQTWGTPASRSEMASSKSASITETALPEPFDVREYNRNAWNRQVDRGNRWTQAVDPATIERARLDDWTIVLTPTKAVPRDWFGGLCGKQVLCLAGAGGQQGPILAAAGAVVTVYDNSPRQLDQDRMVAQRDGLSLVTVEGDMRDLSSLADQSFDLIVHPCSNTFVPEVRSVWRECSRVLRSGGRLLSGFCNPVLFLFDYQQLKQGNLIVRHRIPYSDAEQLTAAEQQAFRDQDEPCCFGHTLEDQIRGQTAAGLMIVDYYDDNQSGAPDDGGLSERISLFCATLAQKR